MDEMCVHQIITFVFLFVISPPAGQGPGRGPECHYLLQLCRQWARVPLLQHRQASTQGGSDTDLALFVIFEIGHLAADQVNFRCQFEKKEIL